MSIPSAVLAAGWIPFVVTLGVSLKKKHDHMIISAIAVINNLYATKLAESNRD